MQCNYALSNSVQSQVHTHTHTHTVGFITFRFRSNSKCVHNRGLQYKTIIWIFTTAPLSSRTLVFCMQESVSIQTTPLLVLAVLTWTHLYIGVSVRFPARIANWERERELFFTFWHWLDCLPFPSSRTWHHTPLEAMSSSPASASTSSATLVEMYGCIVDYACCHRLLDVIHGETVDESLILEFKLTASSSIP